MARISESILDFAAAPSQQAGEAVARYRPARTLEEVLDAWGLVHAVYSARGYIPANPYGIHLLEPVVRGESLVCLAFENQRLDATLSAAVDGPVGLPLDSVFPREMEAIRQRRGRALEFCLLAHRWRSEPGSIREAAERMMQHRAAMVNMMRVMHSFGVEQGVDQYVAGVHPRHAAFYCRAFGFQRASASTTYPAVGHRPVVLLHGDLNEALSRRQLPYALHWCHHQPYPAAELAARYRFGSDAKGEAMTIKAYLDGRSAIRASA